MVFMSLSKKEARRQEELERPPRLIPATRVGTPEMGGWERG
jgi:hypothetical protein